MAKIILHRQYSLSIKRDDGYKKTITWLPDRHKGKDVDVGTRLTLEGSTEVWTVESRSEETRTPEEVRYHARTHRRWREQTDV